MFTLGIAQANAQCCLPKSDKTKAEQTVQGKTETVKLKITGMTCAGCSNHVTQTLQGVKGVAKVNLEYPGDIAIVELDSSKITVKELISAVEKINYKAEVVKSKD